jgi:cell division protein FtsZ
MVQGELLKARAGEDAMNNTDDRGPEEHPEDTMPIKLSVPGFEENQEMKPRITVFGVGGAGCNAVNNMIHAQLEGVEFVVANTDSQALALSHADRKIQLGATTTRGLGAGSRPEVGRAAAEETIDEIMSHLGGSNMVFITAGMGGGTGTGAAPVIAKAAREAGILTVGVVTKPFHFEGIHRMRIAEAGIQSLEDYVDTLIIIPNQNLFRVANEKTTFADAFKMADDVLYSGVRGVTDLMVMSGLINLDFADIRTVMANMGRAMMGTGEASGERRALDAAEAAIANPLLDDASMKGAKGVLINITGGMDITLFEVDEAANRIRSEVDGDAFVIFGSTFDESLAGKIRISVVATGMESEVNHMPSTLHVVPQTEAKAREAEPAPATAAAIPAAASAVSVASAEPVAEPDLEEPARPAVVQTAGRPSAFLPPRPATRETAASPEPFAAAAMTNGEGARPRTIKGPSLFERVTGTGRAKQQAEPTLRPQPMQRGLDQAGPAERAAEHEDDLLDIPTFLRRQAN